jgi:hypothetical protein
MTAQLASLPNPNVYAVDGVVHDLATADPDLLTLVVGAGDPEAVVQRALSTGARALAIAQVSVDTAVVENSFAALETQLRSLLDDTTTRVTGTTADLLGHPEHGISATLGSWKSDIASLFLADGRSAVQQQRVRQARHGAAGCLGTATDRDTSAVEP